MLDASAEAARQALDLARRTENKFSEAVSLEWFAWANHLLGKIQTASKTFLDAEKLEQEHNSSIKYIYSINGIQHADHLRRTGDSDYARRVTVENLKDRKNRHLVNQLSDCYRVLGDLDFDSGNHESARAHYESALKIARGISDRRCLIEALLAHGRFYAKVAFQTSEVSKTSEVSQAFTDLNEALNYSVEGGYRIYEADIRVALGWAYLANGEKEKAKQSAQRALQMSQEMGYHWGKVDGEEVMKELGD